MTCVALKTFYQMLDEGLEPGATAYIAAICACGSRQRKSVRILDAMKIYENMKDRNIRPTARSFVPLFRLSRQSKKCSKTSYKHILTLINDMKAFEDVCV